MQISIGYLQNDMIKTSDNGGLGSVVDSVKKEVIVSDTTLRSFIPPPFCKINPRLCQICGCKFASFPRMFGLI